MVHAALGAVLTVMLATFPGLTGDVREASATESCSGSTESRSGALVHERVAKATTIQTTRRGDRMLLECRIAALLFQDSTIRDAARLNFGKYQGIPATVHGAWHR